ncbi:hypothetical protein [Spirosoma agri]|uniref:hypothetical protein n=1 Tax=Spirosoma agri TaxID=1987381 RepID=UPI00147893D1|nr:hypothetical protein [Spirosoma agri]
MKKIFALLFVGSTLAFAACQSKPKTEAGTESTATMSTDTMTMATDSSSTMATDSMK